MKATKRCSKCKQSKAISEFNKRRSSKDGFQSHCKLCQSKYQKTEEGQLARKRYDQSEKGKANHRKGDKKYLKTEKGKAIHQATQKRFYATRPNEIKAARAVNNAIRDGKIPKPSSCKCKYCEKQAEHYHHYKGYARENWLEVEPVCTQCHYKCNRKVA